MTKAVLYLLSGTHTSFGTKRSHVRIMSPRLFTLFVDNTYKQGTNRTTCILRVCRLEYVSESGSGDVPVFFPALTIPEVLNMCAQTAGTLPKPRLHKRGYQRIRVGGRDFTLGKPGSQEADERYKAKKTKNIEDNETCSRPRSNLCGRFTLYSICRR